MTVSTNRSLVIASTIETVVKDLFGDFACFSPLIKLLFVNLLIACIYISLSESSHCHL